MSKWIANSNMGRLHPSQMKYFEIRECWQAEKERSPDYHREMERRYDHHGPAMELGEKMTQKRQL